MSIYTNKYLLIIITSIYHLILRTEVILHFRIMEVHCWPRGYLIKELKSRTTDRVLGRISKMPVQKSILKIFARPDLATYLLQILIPATFDSLVCPKGQFTLQLYVLEDGLSGKYLVITPQKSKLKNHHRNFCLSKQEVFRKLPVQKTGRTGPG